MGLFTIKQGAHYHQCPPFSTLPWIGPGMMVRTVTFDANCQYASSAYHAQDVNKLFGMSFGIGGVHHNSARFGWRWNPAGQCIDLLAYCYVNGIRNQDAQLDFPLVAQVKPGEQVRCAIVCLPTGQYGFSVTGKGTQYVAHHQQLPPFGLTHGLYFGGDDVASHAMSVRIDRT